MRICLHTIREVAPDFVGGTERLLVELAKELAYLGHEPFILSSGLRGDLLIDGVPLIQKIPDQYKKWYLKYGVANSAFLNSVVMGGSASEQGLRSLGQYVDDQLRDTDADIIHLNSFATSLYSVSARGAFITNHENEREYDSKCGEGFTRLITEIVSKGQGELKNAALLTTPSEYYAHWYSNAFKLEVSFVKAGVSLTSFSRKRRRDAYKKINRPSLYRILLPSRFDPFQKGHDIAIKAFRIVLESGIPAQFIFSGVRDDYKTRLGPFLEEARFSGIADHVVAKHFLDIHTAYNECDLVVSPERYCSYGLSISEALALGVPTVLSDIPTYKEIALGYAHAKFFTSEEPEALAKSIIEALSVDRSLVDQEAIRFRINNDLRLMALKLHNYYCGT